MKFNTNTHRSQEIRNHEGAPAFKLTKEFELYSAVVTASLSAQFYTSETEKLQRIQNLILECDPVFVAQLAIYTREQMHLRSVPLVLLVELSKIHNGDDLLRRTTERVVQRADEITELLAYYQQSNQRWGTKKLNKLSKQLQKGLAAAFNKFDEYQFAKYNRQAAVTLKDALFLVHPKAKDEQQQIIFNKIVEDSLATPYTWEVELSRLGQRFSSEMDKRVALRTKWTELIHSGKLGYMASLRNLRNMLQSSLHIKDLRVVANRLADPEAVRKSRQLPFRFVSAYRELKQYKSKEATMLLTALEAAIKASVVNVKGFDPYTKVLIAADVSGSMNFPVSPRSKIRAYDIGLVMGALFAHYCKNATTGVFGDTWKEVPMGDDILKNTDTMFRYARNVGWSTNGYKVIEALTNDHRVMDKVLIFTDMQMWDSRGNRNFSKVWKHYKHTVAPKAKLYLFDLQGYGQAPVKVEQNDVYLIAGWSDKVFDVLFNLEQGTSVIDQIREYT